MQSAYKTGHSTETALLYIKNDIDTALSKGMPIALIMFDLSAAFDTIDHSILLRCLKSHFGFPGVILQWFSSYLSDRKQYIKVADILSDACNLLFGVP